MNRGKKLVGLLVVLAVLAVAAGVATRLNAEEQEETDEAVSLLTDAADATALTWTHDGETLAFAKTGDDWSYPADSDFPLDGSYLEAMVSALTQLTASKTIPDAQDLAQYGLEDPACTITVTAGETVQVLLGDETALDGDLYCSIGDGNVYLVDAGILDSFDYALLDLVEKESIPAMISLNSITIDTADRQLTLEHLEDSGLSYSDQYVWFLRQADGYQTLDTELTEALASELTGLTWGDCVAYRADATDLAAYGLDTPGGTVTVTYTVDGTADTFALELGDTVDSGCYARIAGSGMVYLIDADTAADLLGTTAADLLPDEVLLMDLDEVTGVDVALDGGSYAIGRTLETTTDDSGNETTEAVSTLNGASVDIEDALTALTGMASTGSAYGLAPTGDATLCVALHRDTASFSTVTLAFYPYGSDTCLVTLDGEATVLVSSADVDALTETLRTALAD